MLSTFVECMRLVCSEALCRISGPMRRRPTVLSGLVRRLQLVVSKACVVSVGRHETMGSVSRLSAGLLFGPRPCKVASLKPCVWQAAGLGPAAVAESSGGVQAAHQSSFRWQHSHAGAGGLDTPGASRREPSCGAPAGNCPQCFSEHPGQWGVAGSGWSSGHGVGGFRDGVVRG